MIKNSVSIACFIICILSSLLYAQDDLAKYSKKYPNKNGVFLDLLQDVTIDVGKDGLPEIIVEHSEERLFLNDNFKFYTTGEVGFSSFSSIKSISPIVYTNVDGKYKKSKVTEITEEDDQDSDVFHDDYKIKKFYYSGLEKGGKTSLSYVKEMAEPYFFGSFYFSSYLPVENSTYTLTTPADMKITYVLFGDEKDKVTYSSEIKGKVKIHTWNAAELTDFKSEAGSVDFAYFATHIQLYINSYNYENEEKYIIRNIGDLYAHYRGYVNKVNQNLSPELKMIADSITQGLVTDDEKVEAIFYWVQDNIKYVAFESGMGGFVPREADLVCERRYGDCKDMSSILYQMINGLGIKAYYTWIGSRSIPYTYHQVPTPATDNHMICTYFDGEKYVFLDATGKGVPYGRPTSFIQGKEALIGISETEYVIDTVPIAEKEFCTISDTFHIEIIDGMVIGNARERRTGYNGNYMKERISNMSVTEKKDFYENGFKVGNNKCKSTVDEVLGIGQRKMPLIFNYSFEIPDYIRVNGDEIFYNPFLNKFYSGQVINLETNKLDRENQYKEVIRSVYFVKIPEGYQLEYLPEGVSKKTEEFSYDVKLSVDEVKNEIEISTNFEINYLILESEKFPEWNDMVKKLNKAYTDLIVFKKKNG